MSQKRKKLPNMQHRPSRKQQASIDAQAESSGETVTYYIHGPHGIHAQQTDDEWEWMLQDGLDSIRSVVDNDLAVQQSVNYDPYGNPFGLSGSEQTVYGYVGEPVDASGQVYLRNRYYNPSIGTFISPDSYEGTPNNPLSLNRYSYVQGNPVNLTDPSGTSPVQALTGLMQGSPLAFARMMNAGMCSRIFDLTPTQTPCAMRDLNGVNVLAATAYTETDDGGILANDPVAVTALMTVQMNSFIASRERAWFKLGTWTQTPESIIAPTTVPLINDIAQKAVDGYCLDRTNPLSLVNAAYPTVAHDTELQSLVGNPAVRNEVSIDPSRVDEFRADPQQPLQYIINPSDQTNAIVIGGANITRARLSYQCAVGQQPVINGDPNSITTSLSLGANHTCTVCTTVNDWWWLIPTTVTPNDRVSIGGLVGQQITATQRYIRVSEANRAYLARTYGGFSYVASCS